MDQIWNTSLKLSTSTLWDLPWISSSSLHSIFFSCPSLSSYSICRIDHYSMYLLAKLRCALASPSLDPRPYSYAFTMGSGYSSATYSLGFSIAFSTVNSATSLLVFYRYSSFLACV